MKTKNCPNCYEHVAASIATCPVCSFSHKDFGRKPKRDHLTATEIQVHKSIVDLLQLSAEPNVIWYHPANGEKRNIVTAVRLKRMGVHPGVADLAFVLPDGRHGRPAFMEIKSAKGRLSPDQKSFRDRCAAIGVPYALVKSLDDAQQVLRHWGALRTSAFEHSQIPIKSSPRAAASEA